jgi:23S rRNA pseudouridine2605 synthase
LLAKVGHKVQRLTRIAVGPVRLGELPVGAVKLLTKQEVNALKEAVACGRGDEGNSKPRAAARKPAQRGPERGSKSPRKPVRKIIS